ncbi:uncharacterized protein [Chelonus insularis]|uniref:uncharacterized protein n=1 Tax=Chelonus insularis TaxID=460826 RepID=UPI00158DB514|nr:uncharacterized protein LOC118069476 [Chelonus insularis]
MSETSSTGLIAARINPIYRQKSKKIELLSIAHPAPFILRPFAGLFNPFPYGCSVLCNHPADCEAKEFIRRAKESWAMEGKAILLPEEMEMIRSTLLAGTVLDSGEINELNNSININTTTTVPEELFRKYTETDSRPLTPTPTLASGTIAIHQNPCDQIPIPCNPRERTTLILDLRTASQEQDETLSWHALTLEPPPSPRKTSEYSKTPPLIQRHQQSRQDSHPLIVEVSEEYASTNRDDDEDGEDDDDRSESGNEMPLKRRGKRLKKRRCRRGSGYGQLNEVRDPLEPLETQVSQVEDTSRRNSSQMQPGNTGEAKTCSEKITTVLQDDIINSSFISSEILKHLVRELDKDIVEEEFRLKRKIALEEALKIKEETNSNLKTSSRSNLLQSLSSPSNAPRIFSRQSARFELLNSSSLARLTPLDYLEKHVFITSGRKLIFGRTFNKFYEENLDGKRLISPNDFMEALQEVMGKSLNNDQLEKFKDIIGEITKPLNFRTWCGICAVCERLLCPLPPRDLDSPTWIEKADFEALEQRLQSAGTNVNPKLVLLLREIRDR